MAIKQKTGEDFSDEKVAQVIALLDKGETKKACYNILGMNPNPTRLTKIIDEYHERVSLQSRMRNSLRNKPLDEEEIIYICQAYLNGDPLTEISNNIYRTANVVKNVLKRYNIPLRNASNNYFNPVFIEDETPEDYEKGDLVFSARYNSMAEVVAKIEEGVYRICVLGNHQRYAAQPSYELADLRKVQEELGISGVWEKETRIRAWQSILDAQKKKKRK